MRNVAEKHTQLGIARMRGGEGPARIKKTQYVYSFLTAEKMYKLPEMGGGNLGNARKKTFFF